MEEKQNKDQFNETVKKLFDSDYSEEMAKILSEYTDAQLSALQKELAEKDLELEALREWKKTQLEIWGELYSTKRLVTDLREAIYLNDGEKAISLLNEYEQSYTVETKPVSETTKEE